MDPSQSLDRFIALHGIEPSHLLVAVSGGPDSTALLLCASDLRSHGFTLTAAHVNHHLRGDEAGADEAFVRRMCETTGIGLQVLDGTLDPAARTARGIEAAAREVRYTRLRELRGSIGATWTATGHQSDDQAETVLMKLLTGSGRRRLGGIAPITKDGVIRPLLESSREDILRFLDHRGVTARVDAMNRDPRFLRSRIRSELVPLLRAWNPRIVESLGETARQARETEDGFTRLLDLATRAEIERTADSTRFTLRGALADEVLLREILHREIDRLDPDSRDVGSEALRRLSRTILDGTLRRVTVTSRLVLDPSVDGCTLRTVADSQPAFEAPLILNGPPAILGSGNRVSIRSINPVGEPILEHGSFRQRFQLPTDHDQCTFVIRSRRPGDRFRPLGMLEEKKLSDFLIDRKIPSEERDSVPLLVWRDEIVWVGGIEIGDRFRILVPLDRGFEVTLELATKDLSKDI